MGEGIGVPAGLEMPEHLFQFPAADHAGHVMADGVADDLSFHRRHGLNPLIDHLPRDTCESVAIIEHEWGNVVALATEVEDFMQREWLRHGGIPKIARGLKVFARLISGCLLFTKRLVQRLDFRPGQRTKPGLFGMHSGRYPS